MFLVAKLQVSSKKTSRYKVAAKSRCTRRIVRGFTPENPARILAVGTYIYEYPRHILPAGVLFNNKRLVKRARETAVLSNSLHWLYIVTTDCAHLEAGTLL